MLRRILHKSNIALLLALLCLLFPARHAAALDSITIMADNSMNLALVKLARGYSSRYGISVTTSFAVPAAQEAQITDGVAADIIITPQQAWIEQLKTRGLIDIYSPTVIARSRLVLVGPETSQVQYDPSSNTLPTAAIINDIDDEQGFVVANPETLIEGGYSKDALRTLDEGDYLAPYTLYIKDIGQMYDMVAHRGAYGIFLNSSTVGRTGFKALGFLPETSYRPIQYTAVVVAGEKMDEARRFMEYLKSPRAKAVLRDNGFTVE
jgi:molybdate transport system substrate-binding protein